MDPQVETALAKERRKRAEAEAALAEEKRKVAALQAEQRKAAEALQALEERQREANKHPDAAGMTAPATEVAGAVDAAVGINPLIGFKGADAFTAGQQLLQQALPQPAMAMKHSTEFFTELGRIRTRQSAITPDAKDKRFLDQTWADHPLYKAYLQTYLLWDQSLHAFVDDAGLAPREADRARFVLSLFTQAVAPTNTMLGNPAAMKRFYETGGASAVRGLVHMLEDLAKNGGLSSQVNMKAFQVGKDLALTPGSVVFKNEVLELIQYTPATGQVYQRPLLMVPPQINKFYVMDLSPGKSFVEFAVKQGLQVFCLSWRNPTPAQGDWGLDTYMQAILDASDAVRAITGSPVLNTLGTCSGGVTLSALLGHLSAREDRRIQTATLFVTVLDSSVESQLGLFATPETIEAAKQVSRVQGVFEGQEMARVFAWMRPNDLIWNYWVNNYLIGNDSPSFDVLYWNNDTTRLPARLHSEMLDIALSNPFTHPGAITLLETPIDLSKVTCDAYIMAGVTNHITPWKGCYATPQLLGGTCEFVLSSAGHIQSILNPPGNPKAKYFTAAEYPADPDQWFARAKQQAASWWEHWRDWLWARSGERKPAPKALGNTQYQPEAPAPGTYVLEP
jgi:polyhydroxyalkanoate synthase